MRFKSDEILVLYDRCENVSPDRKASILKKFLNLGMVDVNGNLTDRGSHAATLAKMTLVPPRGNGAEGCEGGRGDDNSGGAGSEGGEGAEGKGKKAKGNQGTTVATSKPLFESETQHDGRSKTTTSESDV